MKCNDWCDYTIHGLIWDSTAFICDKYWNSLAELWLNKLTLSEWDFFIYNSAKELNKENLAEAYYLTKNNDINIIWYNILAISVLQQKWDFLKHNSAN